MTWAGPGSEYKKENCTVVRQKDIYDNDLESWFIQPPLTNVYKYLSTKETGSSEIKKILNLAITIRPRK